MVKEIVLYSSQFDNHSTLLDEFEERLIESSLNHYASELLQIALQNEEELEMALEKAMTAICAAHESCRNHFKKVFISYGEDLRYDWRVSDLAFRLILMNADPSNPLVARMQVESLRRES